MSDIQKVVVVTGSSHGIGAAFVNAYRERVVASRWECTHHSRIE
ncbi:NAD(P)-dependent dehydrogenase (short-subunit alcohol dehydrogenase family) [Paraburkholderia sp. MM6662-R1]